MKKKLLFIILFIVLSGGLYFADKYAYAGEKKYYPVAETRQDKLRIGIIGDSWLVREKLDSLVERKLSEKGISAKVFSSGNPGATSKVIYENLFKEENEDFSSRKVIESHPEYCIVVAGVNDAAKHLGPAYYAHHMELIINTLLHYNIRPVVVSLPGFGVEEDFQTKNIFSRLSNSGAELILNNGAAFTIKEYRNALTNSLRKLHKENRITVLDFDRAGLDYNGNKKLYADPLHLNKKGYQKFSEFLASGIINLEQRK